MSNTLTFTEQINESVKTAQILLKKLLALFEIVDSSANIKSIFGHEIRNLLILACTEVESSWKAILNRNNATSARDTKDYFNLHNALHLDRYLVHFTLHPALTNISPFSEWNGNQTTQSLSWYHAYNTTKHNREEHLADANLDHCVSAISAILILLQSQFGPGQSFWKQGDFLNVSVIMDYDWKAEEHYLPTFFIKPAKPNWQERLFLFSA